MYKLTVIPGKLRIIPIPVLVIAMAVAMGFVNLPKAYASANDGIYVGLGLSNGSINSDFSAIGNQNSAGYFVLFGSPFAETWSFELEAGGLGDFDTGPTPNIFYPADSAYLTYINFGIRKSLWARSESNWTPWLAARYGYYYYGWNTFAYSLGGSGPSASFGIDLSLGNTSLLLRLKMDYHRFQVTDLYDYGPYQNTVNNFSSALIYQFD